MDRIARTLRTVTMKWNIMSGTDRFRACIRGPEKWDQWDPQGLVKQKTCYWPLYEVKRRGPTFLKRP